ncbi:MAG: glycerophosphodiester phosphodiesterase family protein [Kiritimatiellaeota bacterium]|nr:glycerophosphodiester phosphodiesterase family protein [Kiritimatiellota bacterium]
MQSKSKEGNKNFRSSHNAVEIIAHRGASAWAPENTLAAFDLAWQQNADAIECDIHLSRDGHCVISHDASTVRAVGSGLIISQHTLADLKKLDMGRWKGAFWAGQTIPTLKETLARLPPGKRIFIEVKSGLATVPALKKDILSSSLSLEQVVVISFDADVIAAVKRELSQVEICLLSGLELDSSANKWKPAASDLLAKSRACNADGLDLLACAGVDEEFITMARAAGLKVFVWTVNNPDDMRNFLELGVDGIATDYPAWARRHRQWHISGRPFLNNGVTAHRGNSAEWPENTLPAFQNAMQIGADWLELDVKCTVDGQLVVMHDENTGRVGDANLNVLSTYAELKKVDVACQFRQSHGLSYETCPRTSIPLLAEVLALAKRQDKTRISIHPGCNSVSEICDLVKNFKAEAHVGFNNISLKILRQARYLLGCKTPLFWDREEGIDLDADIRLALEEGIETIVLYHPTVTSQALDRIHKAGLLAGVWTIDDFDVMKRLLAWGIDRIYTNNPALLLKTRRSFPIKLLPSNGVF